MTVVVTGASGHVGANLVRALLAQGRKVRAVVRDEAAALEGLDVERVEADVTDIDTLRAAFVDAELVYHLAACISIVGPKGGEVHAVNVEGPRNVAQVCLEQGVRRLVHFSSVHAFEQGPCDVPLDETNPLVPPTALAYDASKAEGVRVIEEAVAEGLDAVIVHPTGVLGPHDYRGSRMGIVLKKLYEGRLPGLVRGGFNWVDVRDVVAGAMAAEAHGRTGERYLLSGHYATMIELAALVAEHSARPAPGFISPMWLAKAGAPFSTLWARVMGAEPLFTNEALHAVITGNPDVRHDKASAELGYEPRPLSETIRDTLAWHFPARSEAA